MDIDPITLLPIKFLSLSEVMEITSLSSTTIWREEKSARFPRRRKLSPNRVAWVDKEIYDWIGLKVETANDL
ncbi:AlpA family transcriptional regulator [Emcibacteraceae bacterium]|jgi:prophage regulatory protein|nr:AlpA family transcriptional regulator [Emcibacteraceae bacterium]